jgi:hypothetical protein
MDYSRLMLVVLYVIITILMLYKFNYTKKMSSNEILVSVLLLVLVGLSILYTLNNGKEKFTAPVEYELEKLGLHNNLNVPEIKNKEEKLVEEKDVKGENKEDEGAPIDYKMGPYSNIYIDASKHQDRRALIPGFEENMFLGEKESTCGQYHSPCKNTYIKDPIHVTPTGEEEKLKDTYTNQGPSIDGKEGSPKKLFMFAYNRCHPGCCPSTYSCSGGCVCTTVSQRKFIGNGGQQ